MRWPRCSPANAVAPFAIEAELRKRLTLLDTPGLVGLALAGVDMCAWDVLAQAAGLPLAKLLGGELKPIRAYNSCGLWIQPPWRSSLMKPTP